MKKGIRNLCVAVTASALLFSATPSVEAGFDWGSVLGSVIGKAINNSGGNNSSNGSSGGNGGLLSGLSNQKHAVQNPNNNEKLFMLAIYNNDAGTVQAMLDTGVDVNGVYNVNLGGITNRGTTPLGLALLHNNRDMMQLLLENGANVNGYYDFGNEYINYFVYASQRYHDVGILEYLHNWGADINSKDANNNNALNVLSLYSSDPHVECARYLLENGIDPDNIPYNGDPKFLNAVGWPDYEMIDLLASYGANINARDQKGRSALDIALAQNNLQLYKYVQDVLARGQQPSKYRAVKEAAQAEAKAKKAKKDEVTEYSKNISKAIYTCNDVIKSFNENMDTLVKGAAKDRVSKANKMLAKINDALKLIDSTTVSLSSCSPEEKELLIDWKDNTKASILKEKELIEIFTSEQELSYEALDNGSNLAREAGDLAEIANNKKKAAEELLKMKI